jgi:hypothetical protein
MNVCVAPESNNMDAGIELNRGAYYSDRDLGPICLAFFSASGQQKLLRTIKRSRFSVRFYKNCFDKNR